MSDISHTANAALRDLLTLLQDMIKERRASYRDADDLVVGNLERGGFRYGKNKLKLSMDKLKEHMEAVTERRRTQRQLQVLVPLMRRVVSCLQPQLKTINALDDALNPFRAKLATYSCASGSLADYEKPVADLLVTAFPGLLAPDTTTPAAPVADAPKVDEKRNKLYNKITSAGLLTGKEIEHLRVIFWGE